MVRHVRYCLNIDGDTVVNYDHFMCIKYIYLFILQISTF